MTTTAMDARRRHKDPSPKFLPLAEIPTLLRACGKAPTTQDLDVLLKGIPETGVDLEGFYALFEQASEKPNQGETHVFDALRALDLLGEGTLDPVRLKDVLTSMGDRVAPEDVDRLLEDMPRDRLGRVSCRALARSLVKGPDGLQRV